MPQRLPAELVLDQMRTSVPVLAVRRLRQLSYSFLNIAHDETRMMKERCDAVKALDIIISRMMDVLGQPERPKVMSAGSGKRRRGSGAIDLDAVIDQDPTGPTGAPNHLAVVPAMPKGTQKAEGESEPVTMPPGMEQFM